MEKFLQIAKRFVPRKLFLFLQPLYHYLLALAAALFYGFPARHLVVIGVTGTKGKTTVVELLHKILGESGAGVASLSSLRFRIGKEEEQNLHKMTLPGRFFVQGFLHKARKAKCKYAVLEVTSEGIKQFRHRFIKFDVSVMTNVAPEHIETHGSFEKYLRSKLDLFWRLSKSGIAIINREDPNAQRFLAATGAKKILYGRDVITVNTDLLSVRDVRINNEGIEFGMGDTTISSRLLGEFNFYNILAAVSGGLSQHIALEKIAAAISVVSGIPGRMEFIQREPFAVVVDYAHTPDSLRKVYEFLKPRSQRLICVLGATGGGRDKWKRPEFGKIAAEFCDEVILTNEDPYDENPEEILNQISSGFLQSPRPQAPSPKKILDRREAIREAIKLARPGDTVIITGKGAEPWIMGPKGERTKWDDREAARECLVNKSPHLPAGYSGKVWG